MKTVDWQCLRWVSPAGLRGVGIRGIRLMVGTLLLLLTSLGGCPLMAWADELPTAPESPPVLVRTSLEPQNPVVGQQVEFRVDVFVDTWFTQAPQFPEIQVEDAIALLPPSASINLSERIDGKPYSGQRRTYFVFPQRPGRYAIPELSVTIVPAQPGSTDPQPVSLVAPALDFLAQLPPALSAQGEEPILAIPQLAVKTNLVTQGHSDPAQLRRLHTGDTLERTVTLTATDTLASVLPAIAITDTPGLSAYPDPPKLTNRFDRGQFEASRRDRIAYVVERPGHYQIPVQTISWWNTRTQTLQTEVIPAVDLRVKPTFRQRLIQLLPGLVGLLAALGGAMYFRRSLQSRWQTYRHRQNTSAAARWQCLRRACLSNDPQATWKGLNDWLISTSCLENTEPLTLEPWLNQVNSAPLTEAVQELEALLFAPGPENFAPDSSLEPVRPWSGEALLKALTAIRPSRRSRLQPRFAVATDLPPLNPLKAQGEG